MAMDVEESIRAYPLDGVVLLTGCDKTNPASIMGAASADVPAIVVTGGPMLNGRWRGLEIGSCSDCWHYHEELRAGRITACVTEALGLTLPGGAAIPAVDSRRKHLAEAAGRQIVELVELDLKPSDILTPDAFENAIRVLHAISGSTNAILHLLAYAGRVGVELPLQLFDDLCASTPWLVDLKPAGRFSWRTSSTPAVSRAVVARRRPPAPRNHGVGTNGRREHRGRSDRQSGGHSDAAGTPRRGRSARHPPGEPLPGRSGDEDQCRRAGAPPTRGTRDRVRGHPRPREPRGRPRARVRRVERHGVETPAVGGLACRVGPPPIPAKP
jgi:hypothetical protein